MQKGKGKALQHWVADLVDFWSCLNEKKPILSTVLHLACRVWYNFLCWKSNFSRFSCMAETSSRAPCCVPGPRRGTRVRATLGGPSWSAARIVGTRPSHRQGWSAGGWAVLTTGQWDEIKQSLMTNYYVVFLKKVPWCLCRCCEGHIIHQRQYEGGNMWGAIMKFVNY